MLLLLLTLQDGPPRYSEASGMASCCRKRFWMLMTTTSISQDTLTASVRFSRGGGSWGVELASGTGAPLVPAEVEGHSKPGVWAVLPEEPPADSKETKAQDEAIGGLLGQSRHLCSKAAIPRNCRLHPQCPPHTHLAQSRLLGFLWSSSAMDVLGMNEQAACPRVSETCL